MTIDRTQFVHVAGAVPSKDDRISERAPQPPFPPQHQSGPGIESLLRPRPQFEAPFYRPAAKLDGKVALVTGGDSGIGRAVAVIFAREGAHIALAYLPEEESDAAETHEWIENEGRKCLLLPGNLTSPQYCSEVVAKTVAELGKLDILVSNAAHQNRKESLADLSDDELVATFAINILAYVRLARAALEVMHPGSVIIATSSETGIFGSRKLPDYSATKGAVNAFTKSLAQDVIGRGIRVNAIAPGPVWTPLNPSDAGMSPMDVAGFGSDSPMGRPAQPEELAPAYVFLASNADSSYITGTVLQVMGGETSGG